MGLPVVLPFALLVAVLTVSALAVLLDARTKRNAEWREALQLRIEELEARERLAGRLQRRAETLRQLNRTSDPWLN